MKATLCLLASTLALAAPPAALAQEPQRPCGHVLILDNERILEGDITREGDVFRIRRETGELTVPAGQALTVCASLEDAYKFLCTRSNLRDADEHLRLARWCLLNGLHDQAVQEATTAVEMRPSNVESRQFLAMLKRPLTEAPRSAPSAAPAPPAVEAGPLLDVSTECMALFTTRVQPILSNTCACCHASGRGGAFTLVRISDSAGRKSTQQNLTAVIKQICFDQPGASPLLLKACCAHGGASSAALGIREGVPFQTLQGWVSMVVAWHPQLSAHGAKAGGAPLPNHETAALPSGPAAPPSARTLPTPDASSSGAAPAVARTVEIVPAVLSEQTARTDTVPPTSGTSQPRDLAPMPSAPLINADDAFDPASFNAVWHAKSPSGR